MGPKRGNQRQLLARLAGAGSGGSAPPPVPSDCKRAQELFAQFKKGKKRAKAQEEAEAMYLAGANSALCIALAKMHMTLAVEQALKMDEDVGREVAVLASLHAALQYAVTGAVRYHSIQCVVLCVFTLHCCRGRGTLEQKAQRQGWHGQLSDALPAGDRGKWAAVGWVDPRLESHATQDRFGFEWNQRGQHPTVEAWAEAVRDDWTKFMHKARVADTIDFKLLERLPTKNPDSLRELLHEVEQPVDRRLAGNVTPLNNADKEALKQRLDALDQRRLSQHAAGGDSASSTGGGKTAGAAPPSYHASLTSQWLPALHTAQLNKQKQKAEHKRLVEQQARAAHRAAQIREYLRLKHPSLGGGASGTAADAAAATADAALAASASMTLAELQAAAAQLVASRDLSAAEAELAGANLVLLGGEGGPRHVWYGDPLLSTSEQRHSVESYEAMEDLLCDQQRQDWSMFEYAGQLVCRDVEGWQAVVNALSAKPVLLRDPCPDLLLDRFTPTGEAAEARVYSSDLALIDAFSALEGGDELGVSDDDAFSDALSRQASLCASDGEPCEPAPTPAELEQAAVPGEQQQQQSAAGAAEQQQQQQQQQASTRRSGKPLLQRVMDALKQQGQLEAAEAAAAAPAADEAAADGGRGSAAAPAAPQQQPPQQQEQPQQQQQEQGAGQPPTTDGPATPRQDQQQRLPFPEDAEDLQALFAEHHAQEWIPRAAAAWGYSEDQGRQFYQQWVEEGPAGGQRSEFLDRVADAAKRAWLKELVDEQLALEELPPESTAALRRMRAALRHADAKQKERELQPFDILRKKRQRGHDGVALDVPPDERLAAAAAAAAAAGAGAPSPSSPRAASDAGSDAGSTSSGSSWRSGSTGSSLPHLGGMAAADILDSYMRELLHNTLPCLDAILGVCSDAQTECAARLLPEDRLGEARVEQMVRRGFAGHCMVQLIHALTTGQPPRGALAVTARNLGEMLHGAVHPSHLVWHFVTHERAAGEVEGAYRALLELERRSQGRVMSRPVSAVTRVLAPLLLQDWQDSGLGAAEYLERSKCQLARMALSALRHLHARGRLMEGVLWQLNSYILNCLERAGEAAADRDQQEELSRLWEELADVAHDNQDCFNYAAQLPLRMLLPLYTFVGLLCAEAFQSAADVHPLLEDVGVAERSCARLPPAAAPGDSPTLVLLPSAVTDFVAAAAEAQAAVLPGDSAVRKGAGGRPLALPGSIEAGASGAVPAASSDPAALLADYAAGVTEAQRAMQRLQAGGAGVPYALGGGVLGFAAPSGPAGSAADLAERSRLCQQLHRLLYAEAVLGQLFQRCEDISDGLEATGQVLRFMAKGLDEFIAGTLSEPLPPAPPLHVEQQLRDAQYALAAADCAQLALMLANERLRTLCYADTLAALRKEQAAVAARALEAPGQQGQAAAGEAGEAVSIAAAVERFARLHADMQEESRHDRAALQQLASSLAAPASIPLLKSVDLENVAIVDSVLQFAQNIGNVSQPSLQPAIEQYRSILSDKQAEAHERLEQVKAYVVAASRQLEHQRSQLGVLLEWCRIRQAGLIGQLRAGFCAHSGLDQLADLAVRAAAALRWEPELRTMQEQERQANMLALQRELEAEAAESEKRAARAEKRKAQKSRKAAAAAAAVEPGAANGVGSGSSSDSEPEAAEQQQQQQQQQQAPAAEQRQRAATSQPATPAQPAAASPARAKGGRGEGKGTQSAQAAAYQRMLQEYGLDAEAASFAQQLAAKQAGRQPQQDGSALPAAAAPYSKQQQATGKGKVAAVSAAQPAGAKPAVLVAPVPKGRPASAPAGSGGGGGGGGSSEGSGGTGANTVLSKPHGAKELMRVVGYYGDWLCFCGEVNKLWDTCTCGQSPPCRDWVRGICKYGGDCRFSHPPFDLPDGATIPMSERISKPSADAPLYRKGQVVLPAAARQAVAAKAAAAMQRRATTAAVLPALPSANAWQKPLQATLQPAACGVAEQQQQQRLGPPPPPPPPKQQQQQQQPQHQGVPPPPPLQQPQTPLEAAVAAASATPEPLQAMAPASSDTPLLGVGGWNPIGGSAFGLASGLAAASAESSRAATPGLGASNGDVGGLAAAASATAADVLVYPFPLSSGSLHSLSGLHGAGSGLGVGPTAAAAGPGRPWEQRNGSLGGGAGPTGDESAFLSQLMQGLDVGDEGDADLASLLGPIAADVGGMLGSTSAAASAAASAGGSPARHMPLGVQMSPRPGSAPLQASPQRGQPTSLLDALALAQQQQQQGMMTHQQQAAAQQAAQQRQAAQAAAVPHQLPAGRLYAGGVVQTQQAQDGGLLGALAAWRLLG